MKKLSRSYSVVSESVVSDSVVSDSVVSDSGVSDSGVSDSVVSDSVVSDSDVKVTLNFTIYMKEFFYIVSIVTAWRKSVDSKYLVTYNKSIQRIFDTLFIKLFCMCSFITLYSVWCIPLYSIHLNTTRQCQYITTRQCQQIGMLEKVVENCRIYEVSKNVVESSRKMLSKCRKCVFWFFLPPSD